MANHSSLDAYWDLVLALGVLSKSDWGAHSKYGNVVVGEGWYVGDGRVLGEANADDKEAAKVDVVAVDLSDAMNAPAALNVHVAVVVEEEKGDVVGVVGVVMPLLAVAGALVHTDLGTLMNWKSWSSWIRWEVQRAQTALPWKAFWWATVVVGSSCVGTTLAQQCEVALSPALVVDFEVRKRP